MADGTISLKSSGAMRGQIIWWADADVGSNTSTVTAVLQVRKGSEYSGTTGTFSGHLEVGSGSADESYYGEVASDWVDVVTLTQTVSHDSEGKATCYLYGEIKGPSGTSLAGVTVSGSATVTLDTIPRASSFTVSGSALGSAVKFTVTRKSTSYSHAITYQCGTASGTAVSKTTTESLSWTPPLSLAEQNTKGATVSVKFTLTTYNGSTKIASTSKTVSLTIPDSVAPTVSVEVEDATTCYADYGAYVQSKSALKITLTAEGIYGSSISSQQAKFDDKTYLGASSTTDAIKGSGALQLVATVKDSRGKTASATVEINVLAYTPPQISALSVTRCNADGEKNAAGGYLIVEFDASVTALNNKNSAAYTIRHKKSTESAYTDVALEDLGGNYSVQGYAYIFEASKSTSHTVVLAVEDDFGPITRNAVGPSEVTLWSKLAKGMGFAFGKVAERVNYLDMGWPIHMNNNRLHGLPDPAEADDAATKGYVDTANTAVQTAMEDFKTAVSDDLSAMDKTVNSKVQMTKLWQNSSPDSSFAAQKVSVNLSNYTHVGIIYKRSSSSNVFHPMAIYRKSARGIFSTNSNGVFVKREINGVSNTYVEFAAGYYFASYDSSTATASNASLIPYAIYGIKGVS